MDMPKNKRKQKQFMKTCAYKDCGKVFMGISIAKFCPEHRGEEFRVRNRTTTDPATTNRIIKHDLIRVEATTLECECCGKEFKAKLYPRQTVYPKWCPEHTNAHRRAMYEKSLSHGSTRGSTVVM